MEKEELKKLIVMLRSNYRNFVVSTQEIFDFWYEALKDLDYKVCEKAVLKITVQEEFPPTIATIRKAYMDIEQGSKVSSAQALGLVNTAIKKYGRYRTLDALEWLKSENEDIYNVVKSIGFKNICTANYEFVSPRITKMYEEVSKDTSRAKMLPRNFAKEIREIQTNGFALMEQSY